MITRVRQYSGMREARDEWDRLGLPVIIEDERELYTNSFVFVEGADDQQLDLLARDVENLGGMALRCDTGIRRMMVCGPHQMMLDLGESNSDTGEGMAKAINRFLDRGPRRLTLDGHNLILERTQVMGIINVTPDSFSDGGLYQGVEGAMARAREISDHVDIIDVGGESTRPGSLPVTEEEEMRRVIPVIRGILDEFDVPVSVDTRKPSVALRAVEEGASLINDVSGLRDPEMIDAVASSGVPVVVMHMRGEPSNMQQDIHYDDVVGDIMLWLDRNIRSAIDAGVDPGDLIIDPGIGFGKTLDHNLEIIRRLNEFRCMGLPILVGPSRKSFIGQLLGVPVERRLEGTLSAVVSFIMNGADLVRVHDAPSVQLASRMADEIARY
jgi:dihydropteroate synthase